MARETGAVPGVVDVTDAEQMGRLARTVGIPDLVCLNAGIVGTSLGPPWEVPPDEWTRLLNVNVFGVVNGLRSFVPLLRQSGKPARILITASLAGLLTFPGGGAYAASKHALVAEQTALALAGTGVSVTLLCPALVKTAMSDVGEDPAEVAAVAIAAVRSGRFLVVPDEWTPAVMHRTERLLTGAPPQPPSLAHPPTGRSNQPVPTETVVDLP